MLWFPPDDRSSRKFFVHSQRSSFHLDSDFAEAARALLPSARTDTLGRSRNAKGRQAVVRRKRDLDWQSLRLRTFGGQFDRASKLHCGSPHRRDHSILYQSPTRSPQTVEVRLRFPDRRDRHRPPPNSEQYIRPIPSCSDPRRWRPDIQTKSHHDVVIGMGSRRKLERRASGVVPALSTALTSAPF